MNPLLKLADLGQSYWLDNLTRRMIENGELKDRVAKEGLRGITSNPSIFSKAISKSEDYTAQIRKAAAAGGTVETIYEELTATDIRNACDILRPVFDQSGGSDGFVSLEVSPHLARDTATSITEGRRLWKTVDRPNLLIKIPGTKEGVPAIEQLLFEGINVNVTLLFSIDSYQAVAEAHMRALERRVAAGQPLAAVVSVASFFLSRIDVLIDGLLKERVATHPEAKDLLGRAGIANAKLAYRQFKKNIGSARWQALAAKGAQVQRMLWASTSTKNPDYSDVMYVDALIGPHTVNTLPEETIAAFADHGTAANTVEQGMEEAAATMEAIAKLGIDFAKATRQLEDEGIQKFIDPYDSLLEALKQRCANL
ncbi:transaldolase [Shumkonia mesophila]|uniref:transaldolase n=1 Tax=Shumkonia mesophila TaxID=2838854 RepID=UPI002934B31F|nr:transaldolase [Shumkonia mesophila]